MSETRSTCRSCKKPIKWVKTVAGKSMPIDAAPSLTGTLVLEGDHVHTQRPEDRTGLRYVSHFATCPSSETHRKSRTATNRRTRR